MANQVNGRVHLTANITTGSESAWKKTLGEIETGIKSALEGIDIKGVTIDTARLDFVQTASIIGPAESSDDGEKDTDEPEGDGEGDTSDDADVADDEAGDKKAKKGGKKSKAEKAAKGKKKGRK